MRAKCDEKIEFNWKKKQLTTTSLKHNAKGMTTTTNYSRYSYSSRGWCRPRCSRRSFSFTSRSSSSGANKNTTTTERKKKFAASGGKPPTPSCSSSSTERGERRKKTKKTKETRFSDEEDVKNTNKTTNGWRIFDVHIDAREDVGKDDFSISKPILERVCKVLHLDIEDIEDDIERKKKKTSIETILQRNDDYMMKQLMRTVVCLFSCVYHL